MQIMVSHKKEILLDNDDKNLKLTFVGVVDHAEEDDFEFDIEKNLNSNLENFYD